MKIKLLILLSLTLATVTIGFNGFAPDQAGPYSGLAPLI